MPRFIATTDSGQQIMLVPTPDYHELLLTDGSDPRSVLACVVVDTADGIPVRHIDGELFEILYPDDRRLKVRCPRLVAAFADWDANDVCELPTAPLARS
jgi:hypothetical protein